MPPRNRYSEKHAVFSDTVGPSMTKQSFKDETNINNIVRHYDKTGLIRHLNDAIPSWVEFTEDDLQGSVGFDYHQALNIVRAGDEAFMGLPGELRKRFNHDPGEFLEFVDNPENREEAVKMGLVRPERPTYGPPIEGGQDRTQEVVPLPGEAEGEETPEA